MKGTTPLPPSPMPTLGPAVSRHAHALDAIQLGHFISFELWTEACHLLDYQISQRSNNRWYDTLNFQYFEKISGSASKVADFSYYNDRIKNNLFYGLETEFFLHHYTVPKEGIGLREYVFFSYPMQVLYYAIGLYLLRVSQQFLADVRQKHIRSFYGGDLKFRAPDGKLVVNPNTTLYYKHYQTFRHELANLASKTEKQGGRGS